MNDIDAFDGGSRAARLAWRLGVLLVVFYVLATAFGVVRAVDDRTISYAGSLDARELRATNIPEPRLLDRAERTGQFLSDADGVMTRPNTGGGLLAAWSGVQLAGPIVAVLVALLIAGPLRAAGRGDPFGDTAGRRLRAAGLALLVAIPGIEVLDWLVAEAATSGVGTPPSAQPGLVLGFDDVLPGLLVLALAAVFRTGNDLRRFERETI